MKKRILFDKLFDYFCLALSLLAIVPLFFILFGVIQKGIGRINLEFFLENQPSPSNKGGGVANAIVGSFLLVSIATLIAVPFSVLAGLYLSENRKKKLATFIYSTFNILQSVPAIVIGIVAYAWIVAPLGKFSLISGSVALAIMMFPYVTITTTEIFSLIPNTIKEAAYALGAPYYKLFFRVLLPSSLKGILTGILLALLRISGESAPLLFTAFGNPFLSWDLSEPSSSLPLVIFQYAISPYKNWQDVAWAASLILIISIILLNLMTRYLLKSK